MSHLIWRFGLLSLSFKWINVLLHLVKYINLLYIFLNIFGKIPFLFTCIDVFLAQFCIYFTPNAVLYK